MKRLQERVMVREIHARTLRREHLAHSARDFQAHPLARVDKMVGAAPLSELITSSRFEQYSCHLGVRTATWIRAALLQQLYGVESDARWVEELRYNVLYRWFVGLDLENTSCWKASEHAQAWLKLHSHPALLTAFSNLLRDARTVIPHPPRVMNRDLASLENGKWHRAAKNMRPGSRAGRPAAASTHDGDAPFDRAMALIRERISDASLNPEKVSSALNVSRRTLYYIFSERGLSPRAAIREERLEYCKRALMDPEQLQSKIIVIATESGFLDIPTFCRQFKERYGVTPSAVRSVGPAGLSERRTAKSNLGCLF